MIRVIPLPVFGVSKVPAPSTTASRKYSVSGPSVYIVEKQQKLSRRNELKKMDYVPEGVQPLSTSYDCFSPSRVDNDSCKFAGATREIKIQPKEVRLNSRVRGPQAVNGGLDTDGFQSLGC